jgi:hypothetical protein
MSSYQQVVDVADVDAIESSTNSNRLGKAVVALLAVAGVGAVVASRGSSSGLAQSTESELVYMKSGTRPTLHAYVDAM